MKPLRRLTFSAWFLTIFLCAPAIMLFTTADAFAQAPAPAPSDVQTLLVAVASVIAASVAGIDEWLKGVITSPVKLFLATLGVGAVTTGLGALFTQLGNGATARHAEIVALTGAFVTLGTGLQNLVQAIRAARAKKSPSSTSTTAV